jgi:hypothetical protein
VILEREDGESILEYVGFEALDGIAQRTRDRLSQRSHYDNYYNYDNYDNYDNYEEWKQHEAGGPGMGDQRSHQSVHGPEPYRVHPRVSTRPRTIPVPVRFPAG